MQIVEIWMSGHIIEPTGSECLDYAIVIRDARCSANIFYS